MTHTSPKHPHGPAITGPYCPWPRRTAARHQDDRNRTTPTKSKALTSDVLVFDRTLPLPFGA